MTVVRGLVLASQSPWRLRLLEQINIVPELVAHHQISESIEDGELARDYSKRIAIAKTEDVFARMPEKIVLGADTIAVIGRRILTKPKDREQATSWLRMLSGRRHVVYTTVCLCTPGQQKARFKQVKTVLKFKRLSENDIRWHIESNDWQGKAGGYGVNGPAAAFVAWIQGSHSAVAGLPLYETMLLLDNHIKPALPNSEQVII